jgi:hypothetical protein
MVDEIKVNDIKVNELMLNAHKYDRIILKKRQKTAPEDKECEAKECKEGDECAICLDSIDQQMLAYLPCKHFFHHSCLKQAFVKKLYTCPLCRYNLVPALLKTDFKFPIVYDPYTYFNSYIHLAYAYDDDDLPDVDLSEWSSLLHLIGLDPEPDVFIRDYLIFYTI